MASGRRRSFNFEQKGEAYRVDELGKLHAIEAKADKFVTNFPANGLVGHWDFETLSDGVTPDSSGNGHSGRMEGAAKIVTDAERGKVLSVSGLKSNRDGVDIDSIREIPTLLAHRGATLSAWIKWNPDSSAGDMHSYIIALGASEDSPVMTLGIFNHGSPGNGDAILRFTPVSDDFGSWVSDPSFGIDPAERGFALDPDGDDLANGIEAWFGTHPGEFDTRSSDLVTDGTTTTFSHPIDDKVPGDLTGFYQWAVDLIDWNDADGVDGPGGGPTVNIVSNTVASTSNGTATSSEALGRFFLRVKVLQD